MEATGHTLIIGGTGMLRGVAVALASSTCVTTVSRTAREGPWQHVVADWREPDALVGALARAEAQAGPVDRVIVWVHGNGAEALRRLREVLPSSVVVLHLRGSAASRPDAAPSLLGGHPGLREVVLGFVVEGGRSRWLTHREIVAGVLHALEAPGNHVIGTTEPWSARP